MSRGILKLRGLLLSKRGYEYNLASGPIPVVTYRMQIILHSTAFLFSLVVFSRQMEEGAVSMYVIRHMSLSVGTYLRKHANISAVFSFVGCCRVFFLFDDGVRVNLRGVIRHLFDDCLNGTHQCKRRCVQIGAVFVFAGNYFFFQPRVEGAVSHGRDCPLVMSRYLPV